MEEHRRPTAGVFRAAAARAEPPPAHGHVVWIVVGRRDNIHWVEEKNERHEDQMQDGPPDEATARYRPRLLQALAAEDVVRVKVRISVAHATDPAELIFTLRANHVIAAALFLFNYQATARTVGHFSRDSVFLKILLHGSVQLVAAVRPLMIGQPTTHAYLILTFLAGAVVRIATTAEPPLHLELVGQLLPKQ